MFLLCVICNDSGFRPMTNFSSFANIILFVSFKSLLAKKLFCSACTNPEQLPCCLCCYSSNQFQYLTAHRTGTLEIGHLSKQLIFCNVWTLIPWLHMVFDSALKQPSPNWAGHEQALWGIINTRAWWYEKHHHFFFNDLTLCLQIIQNSTCQMLTVSELLALPQQ